MREKFHQKDMCDLGELSMDQAGELLHELRDEMADGTLLPVVRNPMASSAKGAAEGGGPGDLRDSSPLGQAVARAGFSPANLRNPGGSIRM